jgi:hypothetical protein
MVTTLSKNIKSDDKMDEKANQENLFRFMPKFLWLLRDFTLEIIDDKGKRITANQYL